MTKKKSIEAKHDKLVLELRRGILVLATLSQLDEAKYGYSLMQELGSQGLEIEQGTLYPLLRRLEDQELLVSQWNVEGSRPRRYYQLSPTGAEVLKSLSKEWTDLVNVMDDLLSQTSSSMTSLSMTNKEG
jgi:DNA-binding PadR family transcriptional regulator